jgi:hypothetical protein
MLAEMIVESIVPAWVYLAIGIVAVTVVVVAVFLFGRRAEG